MDDFTFSIGDSSNLSGFEAELKRDLNRITRRALNQWKKDSDSIFSSALAEAIEHASKAAYEELLGGIGNASKGKSSSRLHNAIADVVAAQITSLLFAPKTRTEVRETDESRAALSAFRLSRAQQQADNTSHSLKGKRNL